MRNDNLEAKFPSSGRAGLQCVPFMPRLVAPDSKAFEVLS